VAIIYIIVCIIIGSTMSQTPSVHSICGYTAIISYESLEERLEVDIQWKNKHIFSLEEMKWINNKEGRGLYCTKNEKQYK
jgi:hypothetical protein